MVQRAIFSTMIGSNVSLRSEDKLQKYKALDTHLDKNNIVESNWYLRGEDKLRWTPRLPSVPKFCVSLFPMVTTMQHVKISVGTLFQLFLSKHSENA